MPIHPPAGLHSLTADQRQCLLVLGFLYAQNARFADAKILFEAMLKFYPEDEHLLRSLAYCYLHLGDYEHTLDALERCTHPDSPGPYQAFCLLLRSKALWRLGKAQEARKSFLAFIDKSTTPVVSQSPYLMYP